MRVIAGQSWIRTGIRRFSQIPGSTLSKGSEGHYETTLSGARISTSIGGTLTGLGGSLIVIDDPLKPQDGLSDTKRNNVNNWYINTLFSRLDNKETGCIIIVMQRIHLDDLVGFVQMNEEWTVLNLPAIAVKDEAFYLSNGKVIRRKKDDILNPNLESAATLATIRANICHPGQHEGIIDQELWHKVQDGLRNNAPDRLAKNRKTMPSLLMGRLFDESGKALVPSHAVKDGRRYRYYISSNLLTGTARQTNLGWRLPAHEIEQTVAQAARRILNDHTTITPVLREAGITTQEIPEILTSCRNLKTTEEFISLIQRAELRHEGLHLTLALESLVPPTPHPLIINQDIPMRMRRRGIEMRLVIEPSGHTEARIDNALVKAIALAHRWFDELLSGQIASFSAIARREGINNGRVSYIMNLAFLAPDIVETILAGHQPADLSSEILMKRTNLPLGWVDQKEQLGFN